MNVAEYSWSTAYYLLELTAIACACVQWRRWWPHMLSASEEKQPLKLHTRLLCMGTIILAVNFIRGLDPYCAWGWYAPPLVSLLHDVVSSLCFDAFAFAILELELFIKRVQNRTQPVLGSANPSGLNTRARHCMKQRYRSWILALVCIGFHVLSLALDLVEFYNPIRLWTAVIGLQFGLTFATFYIMFILAIVRMAIIVKKNLMSRALPAVQDPLIVRYKRNYRRLLVVAAVASATLAILLVVHTRLAISDLTREASRETIVFRQIWDLSHSNGTANAFVFVPDIEWYGVPIIQAVCIVAIFYTSWLPEYIAKGAQNDLSSPDPLATTPQYTPTRPSNPLQSPRSGKNSRLSRQHYSVRFGESTTSSGSVGQSFSSKPCGQRVRTFWNALLFHLDLGCGSSRLRVRVTDEQNEDIAWDRQSPRLRHSPRYSSSRHRASSPIVSVGDISTHHALELGSSRAVEAKPSLTLTLPVQQQLMMIVEPRIKRPLSEREREVRLAADVSNAITDARDLQLPPCPPCPLPGHISTPKFVRSSYPDSM